MKRNSSFGARRRIGGDGDRGGQIVSSPGPVGVKEDGGLIVSRVLAQLLLILMADVGAKAAVVGATEQLALDLGIEPLSMSSADDAGAQKHN